MVGRNSRRARPIRTTMGRMVRRTAERAQESERSSVGINGDSRDHVSWSNETAWVCRKTGRCRSPSTRTQSRSMDVARRVGDLTPSTRTLRKAGLLSRPSAQSPSRFPIPGAETSCAAWAARTIRPNFRTSFLRQCDFGNSEGLCAEHREIGTALCSDPLATPTSKDCDLAHSGRFARLPLRRFAAPPPRERGRGGRRLRLAITFPSCGAEENDGPPSTVPQR
jgi:hypothetical protein